MKILAFTALTIVGAFIGLATGAADDNRFARQTSMREGAIAGAVCGMVAGGIAAKIAGDKKNT